METIFNHNPSAAELRMIFGTELSHEEYFKLPFDQRMVTAHLYYLLIMRGDDETALENLSKLDAISG